MALFVALLSWALLAPGGTGAEQGRGAASTGPDPMVERWPEWPWPVDCGSGIGFDPVEAFSRPATAELGARPSERALRWHLAYFARQPYPPSRLHNFRRAVETPRRATFVQGRLRSRKGVGYIKFEKRGGRWRGSSSGGCELTSRPPGAGIVTPWSIAEEQESIGPGTTSLLIDLAYGDCPHKPTPQERLRAPVLHRIGSKLIMVTRIDGVTIGPTTDYCAPLTERPVRVRLPQPLGDAHLFDGATYPPVFSEYRWRLAKGDEEAEERRAEIRERRLRAREERQGAASAP